MVQPSLRLNASIAVCYACSPSRLCSIFLYIERGRPATAGTGNENKEEHTRGSKLTYKKIGYKRAARTDGGSKQ